MSQKNQKMLIAFEKICCKLEALSMYITRYGLADKEWMLDEVQQISGILTDLMMSEADSSLHDEQK